MNLIVCVVTGSVKSPPDGETAPKCHRTVPWPDEEKLILEVARMAKIGLLQQNSFDDVDTYCSPEKQYKLLKLVVEFYKRGQQALKDGVELGKIKEMDIIPVLLKARMEIKDDEMPKLVDIEKSMDEQFKNISGAKIQN